MRGLILFLLIAYTPILMAADVKTAGFVQGIWHDRAEIFVDEPVRLYVAIRNNTGSDLTGRVEFRDNDKVIGSSNTSALNNRIIESWVDWNPTYGNHTITATLSRVELSAVGTSTRQVEVLESTTKQLIFVDFDTDKDRIGNEKDTDDDGDGIKDVDDDEPLIFNKKETNENSSNDTSGYATNNGDSDSDKETSSNDTDETTSGLEKFLTDNRADTILTSVTDVVTKAKTSLDDYRERRNVDSEDNTGSQTEEQPENSEDDAETNVQNSNSTTSTSDNSNYSSFGEIERSQIESGGGWVSKVFGLVKNFVDAVYTFILFILSAYLGHPAIVQLTLLFLIIFIIFKVAKRLAGRPS